VSTIEKLTVEHFESLGNGTPLLGLALMRSNEKAVQKDGREYVKGVLATATGTISYKIWPGELADRLIGEDWAGTVVAVKGKTNHYNGMKTMIIEDVSAVQGDVSDFQEKKYDKDSMTAEFFGIYKDNLTPEGRAVFEALMTPIFARFQVEQGALAHHDAVLNGLLAHSLKCLRILDRTIESYPAILERCDKDLLYIGVGCHDLGKVHEYNNGTISQMGKLISHRTSAVIALMNIGPLVIEKKGDDFLYRLAGIFEQHHGQHEETPRTFEAMIVHSIDAMEAAMTDLNEAAEKYKPYDQAYVGGFRLS